MNCPVCNRSQNAALSICPSCGAMINDSVREELIGKVSARLKNIQSETNEIRRIKDAATAAAKSLPVEAAPPISPTPPVEVPKTVTAEIAAKPTSPTLVEFHSKNAAVPEWRLQLQNAVRHRQGQDRCEAPAAVVEPLIAPRAKLVTSGANALKVEAVAAPQTKPQKNPDLARALERIEQSRRKFLVEDEVVAVSAEVLKANKSFPFHIASKRSEADIKPAEINQPPGAFAKPKLAATPPVVRVKLDTNKLPPLAAQIAENFAAPSVMTENNFSQSKAVAVAQTESPATGEEVEEYDDCPTFAMRFNAGLFDLIIGAFAGLCLLAPFMMLGGEWLSGAGFFAFTATTAIVMFVYMTVAIGFYGRTFGMRLFSLELVDIEGEEYPTFHQAAVSSSVYILSLACGGLGFVPMFLNDEKRAAHDLVSKTIIVKE